MGCILGCKTNQYRGLIWGQEGFWYNGNWYNAICYNGIWYNGHCYNGIWYNGICYNKKRETAITESDITEFDITGKWKLI